MTHLALPFVQVRVGFRWSRTIRGTTEPRTGRSRGGSGYEQVRGGAGAPAGARHPVLGANRAQRLQGSTGAGARGHRASATTRIEPSATTMPSVVGAESLPALPGHEHDALCAHPSRTPRRGSASINTSSRPFARYLLATAPGRGGAYGRSTRPRSRACVQVHVWFMSEGYAGVREELVREAEVPS